MYTLYIANRNYSSWSLRGWLCARLSGAPFEEVLVQLATGGPNPAYLPFSPSGLVPCLHDGDVVVWESLAIAGTWPNATRACRPADAKATCVRALDVRRDARGLSPPAQRHDDVHSRARRRAAVVARPHEDIERVFALWTEARRRFGAGGPYLFGAWSIADAFFAPVAFRFQTYAVEPLDEAGAYWRRLLAHPHVREWERAALAETTVIEVDEPRHIYRDKLAAQGRP